MHTWTVHEKISRQGRPNVAFMVVASRDEGPTDSAVIDLGFLQWHGTAEH